MTTYLGSGDASTHRTDYFPEWLRNLADDVTMEASVMNGIVRGPDAVREILGHARSLYAWQEFNYVGPLGGDAFLEDYVSEIEGEPIGSVVIARHNEAGETAEIVISHRPLSSVLLWSRRMAEHFAGTPYAEHFLAPDDAAATARILD